MKKVTTKHDFNAALIGMILFNGNIINDNILYIRCNGNNLNYIDEKVEFISEYLTPKCVKSSIDKYGSNYRYAYYKSSIFKNLYKKIYINNRKSLTKSILNRFNAITLAIMYMDTGCLSLRKDKNNPTVYKSREIHLNLQFLSMNEIKMLQNQLRLRWDIDFHLTRDKGRLRLWCNTENTIKFFKLVSPIVKEFHSMRYKLDLKYNTKDINFL